MSYDPEVDAFDIRTETPEADCASIDCESLIVVSVATLDGHDVVGLEVIGMGVYLPLGKKGYDAESDILLLGNMPDDPDLVTENSDFITYWQKFEDDPDGFCDAKGVAIRNASIHISKEITAAAEYRRRSRQR